MADADGSLPHSKKRAAGRDLSQDNPDLDDEETPELEVGTFKRANDDVLATRRIVKVRRQQANSASPSNPFAAVRLASPTETTVSEEAAADKEPVSDDLDNEDIGKQKHNSAEESRSEVNDPGTEPDTNTEQTMEKNDKAFGEDGKNEGDPSSETMDLSSFQQHSGSQNAFTGLAGTAFSSSAFLSGPAAPRDGGFGFASKNEKSLFPSFVSGLSNNGNPDLFGTPGTSMGGKSMREIAVETGEENEETIFLAESVLFEFMAGGWKERGKGEIKVNIPKSGNKRGRLVMRSRGNYRLILNASLYPDMKLTKIDKKGIAFACLNNATEGKAAGFSTYALRFKEVLQVEEFRGAVAGHKV